MFFFIVFSFLSFKLAWSKKKIFKNVVTFCYNILKLNSLLRFLNVFLVDVWDSFNFLSFLFCYLAFFHISLQPARIFSGVLGCFKIYFSCIIGFLDILSTDNHCKCSCKKILRVETQ